VTERVTQMGQSVPLWPYLRNLRTMARLTPFPGTRMFYRNLLRSVIADYRRQQAERAAHRKAA
jgi:hypothetical protein